MSSDVISTYIDDLIVSHDCSANPSCLSQRQRALAGPLVLAASEKIFGWSPRRQRSLELLLTEFEQRVKRTATRPSENVPELERSYEEVKMLVDLKNVVGESQLPHVDTML